MKEFASFMPGQWPSPAVLTAEHDRIFEGMIRNLEDKTLLKMKAIISVARELPRLEKNRKWWRLRPVSL